MTAAGNIITNSHGATLGQYDFATQLMRAVNASYGLNAEDPEGVSAEGAERSKGQVIQTYDKWIANFTEFEGFNAAVHMEDNMDVCIQLYPSRGHAKFKDLGFLIRAADRDFALVFDGVCEAVASFYAHQQPTHRLHLIHDRKRRGMDLIEIRLVNLYRMPLWAATMVDVFKLLQKTLVDHFENLED